MLVVHMLQQLILGHDFIMEKPDFTELLQLFINQNKLHRTEGSRGVENLCRIVRALGYKDPQNYGAFSSDGCYGDLFCFLEDNSGIIDTIIEKIEEFGENNSEWYDELETYVEESEDDSEYIHATMEDCVAANDHNKSCDDDGYCNKCGNQG